MLNTPTSAVPPARHLLRLPEVFAPHAREILALLGAETPTPIAGGWFIVKLADASAFCSEDAALFIPWRLPLEHTWPCNPEKTDTFIEKAAQTLAKKFAPRTPQAVLVGPLDAGPQNRYYKSLASNLRGRVLQLFPKLPAASADDQNPTLPTLFCLVGKEGLFAGMSTPREANGFHPGGIKFIKQSGGAMISRAGAKIAEALHWLRLYTDPPPPGAHWLELGASPGGMTGELLQRQYRVTAVDRAPLDARLRRAEGLTFIPADAAEFRPPPALRYDALLCDLNGDARQSLRAVIRLSASLNPGGLIIFTLKTPGADAPDAILDLCRRIETEARGAGLTLVAKTHLTHNRQEFTLCWRRA